MVARLSQLLDNSHEANCSTHIELAAEYFLPSVAKILFLAAFGLSSRLFVSSVLKRSLP